MLKDNVIIVNQKHFPAFFDHVPLLAEVEENEVMDVNAGAKRFEGRQEKSTAILLAIIVVFVSCHFLRFLVQIYIVFSSPLHGSQKLFEVRFSFYLSLSAFSNNIWCFFPALFQISSTSCTSSIFDIWQYQSLVTHCQFFCQHGDLHLPGPEI